MGNVGMMGMDAIVLRPYVREWAYNWIRHAIEQSSFMFYWDGLADSPIGVQRCCGCTRSPRRG